MCGCQWVGNAAVQLMKRVARFRSQDQKSKQPCAGEVSIGLGCSEATLSRTVRGDCSMLQGNNDAWQVGLALISKPASEYGIDMIMYLCIHMCFFRKCAYMPYTYMYMNPSY
jgi:hypothetical protein